MSQEHGASQSKKNSFISSDKVRKGNINEVVNYLNSVRKNILIYNIFIPINIERIYHNDVHKRNI